MRRSLFLAGIVVVVAAAACSSSSSPPAGQGGDDASVGDGYDADTWANWGQGFFTRYCVECHAAGNTSGLDFGQQSIVVTNASTIRCGVAVTQDPAWSCPSNLTAKQFPISDTAGANPKPTDAERNRVVAWINAGTP
ncbi:MAG TPA: hypothetical protein VIF09_15720 [Polyangiaceae bacterium]|jgi:hypothetical protein